MGLDGRWLNMKYVADILAKLLLLACAPHALTCSKGLPNQDHWPNISICADMDCNLSAAT